MEEKKWYGVCPYCNSDNIVHLQFGRSLDEANIIFKVYQIRMKNRGRYCEKFFNLSNKYNCYWEANNYICNNCKGLYILYKLKTDFNITDIHIFKRIIIKVLPPDNINLFL
jgi:hypothetical protein